MWNGVNKDVLGLSLMFADPCNGNEYRIPLGLQVKLTVINLRNYVLGVFHVMSHTMRCAMDLSTRS